MDKPIIFFSHSSRDKRPLARLKELILTKCSNSLEIFLSSDGQSIPFGKNWVHQIEKALNASSTFFIFLTPHSLNSNWVHFEAGHAYSKGLDVIPIGLFGIDLNSVRPPLNLLQGFNITNELGLNNIISIINKKFEFSFNESFTKTEFNSLISLTSHYQANILKDIFQFLSIDFRDELSADYNYCRRSQTFYPDFIKYLKDNKIECQEYGEYLHFEGCTLKTTRLVHTDNYYFELHVDPLSFFKSLEVLKNCISLAYPGLKNFKFEFLFNNDITCYTGIAQLSSRLMSYGCHFSDKGDLYYKDIGFYIQNSFSEINPNIYTLNIRFEINKINGEIINELIDILFRSGVCARK